MKNTEVSNFSLLRYTNICFAVSYGQIRPFHPPKNVGKHVINAAWDSVFVPFFCVTSLPAFLCEFVVGFCFDLDFALYL